MHSWLYELDRHAGWLFEAKGLARLMQSGMRQTQHWSLAGQDPRQKEKYSFTGPARRLSVVSESGMWVE